MQGTWVQSLAQEDSKAMLQLLKPTCPRDHALQQKKTPPGETCAPRLEGSPPSLQLEKAHAASKTQYSQKNKGGLDDGS